MTWSSWMVSVSACKINEFRKFTSFSNFQRDFMMFCNNWMMRLYLGHIVSFLCPSLNLMLKNVKTVRRNRKP